MHTHTDTSIYLCNSEYCAVYILRIFRKHTLLYILEDRKSAPMSACFERERDQSIAAVTVVQVLCHLQLKPFLTNTDAQLLLVSIHGNRIRHVPQVCQRHRHFPEGRV